MVNKKYNIQKILTRWMALISDYNIRLDTCKEKICQGLRKCYPNVALGI